ncbi:MAG: hypothetical protein KME16_22230 [Scytolyngbya sp. HA4215-MV1]|jgi:hypothetical protein|nr:hypothetical protein [Scytolyngbya sp. HA4215-MV1]
MRAHFLVLGFAIALLPLPGFAQSERHPTDAEITGLLREMRREMPNLMKSGVYRDRRNSEERRQREAFVKAWSQLDRAIAPFLGNWTAIEENVEIYPASKRGEVCIIDSYLDETDFYLGRVVNGKLRTDTNLTFVLDSRFLVSTFVVENRAGHYEYANPRPVDNPLTSTYYVKNHPKVVEQFQQAGCLLGIPK